MTNEDDWEQDAVALLEFKSVYDSALEAAQELDQSDIDFNLKTKQHYAPQLRKIVSFYIWANLMIEESLVLLFQQELVPDRYDKDSIGDYLRSRHINFRTIIGFLDHAGVFSEYTDDDDGDGLKGELQRSQVIRNKLAHDYRTRVLLDVDDIDTDNLTSDIERMYDDFEKVQNMLN